MFLPVKTGNQDRPYVSISEGKKRVRKAIELYRVKMKGASRPGQATRGNKEQTRREEHKKYSN